MSIFFKFTSSSIIIVFFCFLLSVSSKAADLDGYTHFVVKNKVTVDIPFDWTIRNKQEIQRIKELSRSISGKPIENITNLAADCTYDNAFYMSTRVSFRPHVDFYSQGSFEKDLEIYGDAFLKTISDQMKEEFSRVNIKNKLSFKFDTKSLTTRVGLLDNKKTVVIEYNRTEPYNPNHIIFVEQNHVYTGYEDILITFSYNTSCSYCKKVISRIKKSIHFIE